MKRPPVTIFQNPNSPFQFYDDNGVTPHPDHPSMSSRRVPVSEPTEAPEDEGELDVVTVSPEMLAEAQRAQELARTIPPSPDGLAGQAGVTPTIAVAKP